MAVISNFIYLTNNTTPYTPPTIRGAWDNTGSAVVKSGDIFRGGTATTVAPQVGSVTANWDVLWGRWVSPAFITNYDFAGTETVIWIAGVRENNALANAFFHVHIFVTTGDTDTVRGTILTDNIGATEYTTTGTGRGEGSKTLSAASGCLVGDRICIELGSRCSVDDTARTVTLNYGNAGGLRLAQASTAVTTQPGWFEFRLGDRLFLPARDTYQFNNYQMPFSANAGIISVGEKIR